MTKRFCLLILFCALIAGGLAACGKRGKIVPPPGTPPTYPRQYPQ
jgi:hypothetical protein